jgi:hypothetical protein
MAVPRKLNFDLWGSTQILHSVIILAAMERQSLMISNYHTHQYATLSLAFVSGIACDMCGRGVMPAKECSWPDRVGWVWCGGSALICGSDIYPAEIQYLSALLCAMEMLDLQLSLTILMRCSRKHGASS